MGKSTHSVFRPIITASLAIVAAIALALLAVTQPPPALQVFSVLSGVGVVVAFSAAFVALRRSAKRGVLVDVALIDEAVEKPYALYLRSFGIDQTEAKSVDLSQRQTQEQRLAATVSWAGNPVAVGAPEDDLPFSGFKRLYLEGEWKLGVSRLIADAQLVVLVMGESEGLSWELQKTLEVLSQGKVVLVFGREQLEELSAAFEGAGIRAPDPPTSWPAGARGFVIDGSIRTSRIRKHDWLSPLVGEQRLDIVLRPALRSAGARRRPGAWQLALASLLFLFAGWTIGTAQPQPAVLDEDVPILTKAAWQSLAVTTIPGDFELTDFTDAEIREVDELGIEALLAQVYLTSQARQQDVDIEVEALGGWARISDARAVLFRHDGNLVVQSLEEHCASQGGRFDLEWLQNPEGGWTIECVVDEGGQFEVRTSSSVVASLFGNWLVRVTVWTASTPGLGEADQLKSLDLALTILDGLDA